MAEARIAGSKLGFDELVAIQINKLDLAAPVGRRDQFREPAIRCRDDGQVLRRRSLNRLRVGGSPPPLRRLAVCPCLQVFQGCTREYQA